MERPELSASVGVAAEAVTTQDWKTVEMHRIEKTVFISYRRTNGIWARAIFQDLTSHDYDVFYDVEGIASGDFEQTIIENIKARAHFLVLLTPSALERCDEPGDWLRREIETAIDTRRNIVPLMLEGFDFNTPSIFNRLTGKLALLKHYNGLVVPPKYFDAEMKRLRDKFLNVPLDAVLHPASAAAQNAVKHQQAAVLGAPLVRVEELTAQQWFERGFEASDPDKKIRCYTEAIRLDPAYGEAYKKRADVYSNRGDHGNAVHDLARSIQIERDNSAPHEAYEWLKHASHLTVKGDYDGAITSYGRVLRIPHRNPTYNEYAYIGRADLLESQKKYDKAITELQGYLDLGVFRLVGRAEVERRIKRLSKKAKHS